jgi:hypothetical protein
MLNSAFDIKLANDLFIRIMKLFMNFTLFQKLLFDEDDIFIIFLEMES